MKNLYTLPLLAALAAGLFATNTTSAQVVYQFSADDGAPTAQGFAQGGSSSSTPEATTYQHENAWRVEDADETNTGYQYTRDISASEVATLQSRGYRVSTRLAFLDTDYNGTQSCNFSVADGNRRFLIWIDETTVTGDLILILQSNGEDIYRALSTGAAAHDFYNIAIDVAPGGTTASVLVNGEEIVTGWSGESHTTRRLSFGTGSTAGRGAAAWNRVQVASRIPESDMTFQYLSSSDSYELDAVANVAGHLHLPNTYNDGINGTKNVTAIGNYACAPDFVGHKNIVSLRLPAQLTSIGSSAFYQCSGFDGSLTIPDGVTSIGDYAFYQCSGLSEVCWLGAPPTTYGTTPFAFTPASHYVPAPHLDSYQALAGLSGAQVKPVANLVLSAGVLNGQFRIDFASQLGFFYQLQQSGDLTSGSWTNHGNGIIGNDQTNHVTLDPDAADLRYFRLQSTPQE